MEKHADEMWTHFAPLWIDLRAVADDFILGGGYGLFLKQAWLWSEKVVTASDWKSWRDPNPRVTKDLDVVVGLDLIGSQEQQPKIQEVLNRHQFQVVEKNARWQFEKHLSEDRSILIDFHAMIDSNRDDIRIEGRRVKPKPPIKDVGIHCRENPEAIGCMFHPFRFKMEDVEVVVPNPVAWCLMKLIAMRDRWNVSRDVAESSGNREFASKQTQKHAQDVCRAIAMTTREEASGAERIVEQLRSEQVFEDARAIHEQFFKEPSSQGWVMIRDQWDDDGFKVIREQLSRWFG